MGERPSSRWGLWMDVRDEIQLSRRYCHMSMNQQDEYDIGIRIIKGSSTDNDSVGSEFPARNRYKVGNCYSKLGFRIVRLPSPLERLAAALSPEKP